MPPNSPLIPANGRYALEGRIVTMDASDTVHSPGRVYVDAGRIVGVRSIEAPAPDGHAQDPVVKTRGTIYPGLIELHNHLSYDILGLWQVPRQYTNRDQWSGIPEYRKLISGPMTVLGKTPGFPEAIVRYVECKCLLGGVTTSQGIRLASNAGIVRFYRGIVRNAEQPDDASLPSADSRIPDVDAADGDKFLARLKKSTCLLLHLSEGTDERAREHFLALGLSPTTWAITSALAGIHCVALQPADFEVLKRHDGSMIWSPLSNLLLYGSTADVRAAKAQGVLMGIGSDWSPSGSKNLLGELKVARVVSAALGNLFSDKEIVAMATRNAAAILKWDRGLGSVEDGKHADLIVVSGENDDPYAHLLEATEGEISLVVINGVPRYGTASLMKGFGPGTETLLVNGTARVLNLKQAIADPVVGALKLSDAHERLRKGLRRLPKLARDLEHMSVVAFGLDPAIPRWSLVLDHDEPPGIALRPHLPIAGVPTGGMPMRVEAVVAPLSKILGPIDLDPLTVADDEKFVDRLKREINLPPFVKDSLPHLY